MAVRNMAKKLILINVGYDKKVSPSLPVRNLASTLVDERVVPEDFGTVVDRQAVSLIPK